MRSWRLRLDGQEHEVALRGLVDGLRPEAVRVELDGRPAAAHFVNRRRGPGIGQGEWQFTIGPHSATIYRQLIGGDVPPRHARGRRANHATPRLASFAQRPSELADSHLHHRGHGWRHLVGVHLVGPAERRMKMGTPHEVAARHSFLPSQGLTMETLATSNEYP